eukprot:g9023.t1
MAPPGKANLGETIRHEFREIPYEFDELSALLSRLLEREVKVSCADHRTRTERHVLDVGEKALCRGGSEHRGGSKKLLLYIHYFKEYYHITALLGWEVARQFARPKGQGNPQLKSTTPQALRAQPVPYYLNTVENGVNQRYDLHVKLVDWSRLDPGVDSLETCCARFELPLPLKSPLVFHELREAFRERHTLIGKKLGVKLKSPEHPVGASHQVALLLNKYLSSFLRAFGAITVADSATGITAATGGRMAKRTRQGQGQGRTPTGSGVGLCRRTWAAAPKALAKVHEMFSSYGITGLTTGPLELTKSHLGMVLGGVFMEEMDGQRVETSPGGVDIEIEGYGSGLSALSYPIGHPTLLYFTRNAPLKWPRLHDFLEKWEDELVPNCWMAVVETLAPLTFQQDFLMSNLPLGNGNCAPTLELLGRYVEGGLHAPTVLIKEVKNGVLTSSSLCGLRAAASPEEWTEIKESLRVKAAMIYPKSNLADNYKEWQSLMKQCEAAKRSRNLRSFCTTQGFVDSSPTPWFKVPLGPFIAPLLELRRDAPNKQSRKYYKMLVNSCSSVFGSPQFEQNNPLVANNITDLARVAQWLVVKSTNASLSVTFGCCAVLNQFPIGKAKPGLNTLCGPLRETRLWDIEERSSESPEEVNQLFRKHLKRWVLGYKNHNQKTNPEGPGENVPESKKLSQLVDLFRYKVLVGKKDDDNVPSQHNYLRKAQLLRKYKRIWRRPKF